MNGDVKKPGVAAAQTYFVTIAEVVRANAEESEGVERVIRRRELTEREKSLSSVARQALVTNYAFFQNKGYMGMYNMPLTRIKNYKGLKEGDSLLDHMGTTELAANLFRLTQTEEKIKTEGIRGQRPLEDCAFAVGMKVRETMIEISGTAPEDLRLSGNIKEIQSDLKRTKRRLENIDKNR